MRVKLEAKTPAASVQTRDDHFFGTYGRHSLKG